MKQLLITIALLSAGFAAKGQDIQLPAPDMGRQTTSMMETLAKRHSVREYSSRELSLQDISDLCWAACGRSRDDKHITSPTAMNKQEIRLYAFTKGGVYEYMNKSNLLRECVKGDHRALLCGPQKFVKDAPIVLLMVIDFERFGSHGEHAVLMTCVDAGIVSENINLFCQSAGLVTVPRAMMDAEGISKLLGFSSKMKPILNNPVGFPKE